MKTASPIEFIYTGAFVLVLVLAIRMDFQAARALIRIGRARKYMGVASVPRSDQVIAQDVAEQAFIVTGVVLMLLSIGVVSLFLPPNPANPNGIWTGVAFLIMAALIAVGIVRKTHMAGRIAAEVKQQVTGDGS